MEYMTERKMRNRYGWTVAAGAALVLVAGAAAPPFLGEPVRTLVHQAFAPMCHQLPGRSFVIGGVPLAVGHRCFGIYTGLLAGTLLWPVLSVRVQQWTGRRTGLLVLLAGGPAALDWGLDIVGWWTNGPFTRTATGALLGIALGLVFARAVGQALAPTVPAPAKSASRS